MIARAVLWSARHHWIVIIVALILALAGDLARRGLARDVSNARGLVVGVWTDHGERLELLELNVRDAMLDSEDGPQRRKDVGERETSLAELARLHLHANLPEAAAHRRDFSDARNR